MALPSRYAFLKQLNFETLYNTFLGLQPREQIYALIGAGLLTLFVFGLPISLASSKLGNLEQLANEGRQSQREILRELENYQKVKADLDVVEAKISQGGGDSITQMVTSVAEKSGIKGQMDNINEKKNSLASYDEEALEFRLSKVTLQQLADFLYNIEKNPRYFLRVKQIQIKKNYSNKQLLDLPFVSIVTYRLSRAGGAL